VPRDAAQADAVLRNACERGVTQACPRGHS
jgi:hypothetical protein